MPSSDIIVDPNLLIGSHVEIIIDNKRSFREFHVNLNILTITCMIRPSIISRTLRTFTSILNHETVIYRDFTVSGGNVYNGNVLKIHSVSKEDRGTYYCFADNDVGKGDRRNVNLEV